MTRLVSEYFCDENQFVCECYSSHKQLEAQVLYDSLDFSKNERLVQEPKIGMGSVLVLCAAGGVVVGSFFYPRPCVAVENNTETRMVVHRRTSNSQAQGMTTTREQNLLATPPAGPLMARQPSPLMARQPVISNNLTFGSLYRSEFCPVLEGEQYYREPFSVEKALSTRNENPFTNYIFQIYNSLVENSNHRNEELPQSLAVQFNSNKQLENLHDGLSFVIEAYCPHLYFHSPIFGLRTTVLGAFYESGIINSKENFVTILNLYKRQVFEKMNLNISNSEALQLLLLDLLKTLEEEVKLQYFLKRFNPETREYTFWNLQDRTTIDILASRAREVLLDPDLGDRMRKICNEEYSLQQITQEIRTDYDVEELNIKGYILLQILGCQDLSLLQMGLYDYIVENVHPSVFLE